MRCKTVLERLDDHVDGLLPAPEAERIRDHLDRCAECRETALAVKAASSSLDAWDDVDPPQDCFDGILAKLEALPVEAFERNTPPRPVPIRLPQVAALGQSARLRRATTAGLAAAAAVLATVAATRTEAARTVRRPAAEPADMARMVMSPAMNVSEPAWFRDYHFDDGLLHQGEALPAWMRRATRVNVLEGSHR